MSTTPELSHENVYPLLRLFLETKDEQEAQRLLGVLVTCHARPLVRKIVRCRIRVPLAGSAGDAVDLDDVTSEAVVQVIGWLRDLRKCTNPVAIANFHGYVISIARNAFNHQIRKKYPERFRLKNRLRYVLGHDSAMALWKDVSGSWLCGFAAWVGQSGQAVFNPIRTEELLERLELELRQQIDPLKTDLRKLLMALFQVTKTPVGFEELIGLTARLLGVQEPRWVRPPEDDPAEDVWQTIPDPRVNIARSVEQRGYLEALWREICDLPLPQRTALLLNLRDPDGQDLLPLFSVTGAASLRQLAASLNVKIRDFAELWKRLPLDDMTIAARLGVSRQQVINLRKSARQRLARRMAKLVNTRNRL